MSRQKSTTTETQRFSGPELSELLDRIAREHGPDAAIAAVNKVRSGGVAGFFCKEEFEVVVRNGTPASTGTKRRRPKAAAGSGAAGDEPTIELRSSASQRQGSDGPTAEQLAQAGLLPQQTVPQQAQQAVPAPVADRASVADPAPVADRASVAAAAPVADPASDPLKVLLDAADRRAASREAGSPESAGAPGSSEPQVFGGPRPNQSHWTDTRFRSLVDRRVDEVANEEASFADRTIRRAVPQAAVTVEPEPLSLQPVVPAPSLGPSVVSATTAVAGESSSGIAVMRAPTGPLPEFWVRLQQTQHELKSFMPMASHSVATIGPLSLTTPIVGRLRSRPELEAADVIVLTDRAEIVSEPSWELVRSGNQLLDRVKENANRQTIVLIDVPVELPNWVAPLENRLRMAGVGLFRYAVASIPTVDQLERYRLCSDVPYVLDLVSRVEPTDLVEFVALRHPVSSVAGADLNAELLMAMREQAGVER